MLSIHDITFGYSSNPVLDNVSFRLEQGTVLGLLGPNGAGKSTALKIISGMLKPWSGSVNLNGSDIADWSPSAVARKVSVVPQKPDFSFGFTVRELVAMGRRPHHGLFGQFSATDSGAVERAMQQTGIEHLAQRPVTQLSGGEVQLTIVARALAQETPLMLLDEATASLDIKHKLDILGIVRNKVSRDKVGVVAVMHDLNTALAFCDKIAMFNNGQILGPDRPEKMINEENLRYVYDVDPGTVQIKADPLHVNYQLQW